jgi:hypothetical protein
MTNDRDSLPSGVREPPVLKGTYEDAETLRKWAFLQRTPQQRLDWLISALRIAYASGALKPRRPPAGDGEMV